MSRHVLVFLFLFSCNVSSLHIPCKLTMGHICRPNMTLKNRIVLTIFNVQGQFSRMKWAELNCCRKYINISKRQKLEHFFAPSFVLCLNQIFLRRIFCWPCPASSINNAERRQELGGMSVRAKLPSQVIGLIA